MPATTGGGKLNIAIEAALSAVDELNRMGAQLLGPEGEGGGNEFAGKNSVESLCKNGCGDGGGGEQGSMENVSETEPASQKGCQFLAR